MEYSVPYSECPFQFMTQGKERVRVEGVAV